MTIEARLNELWNEFWGLQEFCPLQAVVSINWNILSLDDKWNTVPLNRALKYYIPLGDISIVAWPAA